MTRASIRVVSLVPSVTETLLEWGIEPVACTRFCEQPSLTHVGGTKDPDLAAIVALAPDLVVVDREENRREDAEAIVAAGLTLHVTHVTSLADVTPMLTALAVAVGVDAPLPGISGLSWLAANQERPENEQGQGHERRRAFVPIWRRPWMTLNADTYGSSVLAALGIDNMYGTAADRYPTVELDDVARTKPDLVILPSEPYPFTERHVGDVTGVAADVRLVDGRDLFWWGVRTQVALARLAHSLA